MSSEIRSTSDFEQPPTHYMHIGFDNFSNFQRTHIEQNRNPLDNNFDWWYWCGIKNNEEKQILIQQYNDFIGQIPENFYNNQNVESSLNRLVQQGIMTPEYAECLRDSITNMNGDFITNNRMTIADHNFNIEQRRMFFRILFTIYTKSINKGKGGYVQGESFLIGKLWLMLQTIENLQNIEQLLYLIYLNIFIKTPMKMLIQPAGSNARCSPVYPEDKLKPFQFMGWLLIVMIIKKNKNNWSLFINDPQKTEIDNIFSGVVQSATSIILQQLVGGPLITCRINDFKKIIGNLLVSKDITQWIAYVLSYWCSYIPEHKQWNYIFQNTNEAESEGSLPYRANGTNLSTDDIIQHLPLNLRGGYDVYDNPLNENEFNRIYRYFRGLRKQGRFTTDSRLSAPVAAKQRTRFESIVLLCTKKSWKKNKRIGNGGYKYILPRKFIKGDRIWSTPLSPAPENINAETPESSNTQQTSGNVEEAPPPHPNRRPTLPPHPHQQQSSRGRRVGPEQTPYFGANKQTFFINQWSVWSEANIGDPLAIAYGEFTNLAAAVGGGQYGANSPTFVPFLYLVANENGGNYDITQGQAPNGDDVNWTRAFTPPQLQELNQSADSFSQWANQHNQQLIRVLIQFLTDVNQDPATIQVGGKRKKKRRRYKSLKKSNRKLNRTIKLR